MTNIIITEAPERVGDWEGCHVMSLSPIKNYYMNFPARTIFKIVNSGKTKSLESLPCKCCGLSGFIRIKSAKGEFLTDFCFVELAED
jgi:hypothetical protein